MVETDVLQKLFRAFPNSVINHFTTISTALKMKGKKNETA